MTSANSPLPAVPHPLSPGRQNGEGIMAFALPNLFRRARAFLTGNPAAIELHRLAAVEADLRSTIKACQRRVYDSITHERARPAQSGADHASLAQPVPYHALHGETGEGSDARRARYDLPASVQVALALGFAIPILAIVIVLHGGVG